MEEGERSEVRRFVAEQQIEALERMEAKRLEAEMRQEAELRQEDELRQESELRQEAELRHPKVETTEEGEGSKTYVLEEEEVREKDNMEEGDERTATSGE